jgi:hypothetical protein
VWLTWKPVPRPVAQASRRRRLTGPDAACRSAPTGHYGGTTRASWVPVVDVAIHTEPGGPHRFSRTAQGLSPVTNVAETAHLVHFGVGTFAGVTVAGRMPDRHRGRVVAVGGPLLPPQPPSAPRSGRSGRCRASGLLVLSALLVAFPLRQCDRSGSAQRGAPVTHANARLSIAGRIPPV